MSGYFHETPSAALLDAAEAILERDGIAAVTLDAIALATGLPAAEPALYFHDLTGLLSEVAAIGYNRFANLLNDAADFAGPNPRERMIAMGKAYVRFAGMSPALFGLMFGRHSLDKTRPALKAACKEAFDALRGGVDRRRDIQPDDPVVEAIAAWSLVHGFAMLLIDCHLPPDRAPEALLDAILRTRRSDTGC